MKAKNLLMKAKIIHEKQKNVHEYKGFFKGQCVHGKNTEMVFFILASDH